MAKNNYICLAEWGNEKGYIIETCLAAQDAFEVAFEYFRIR